MNMLQNRINYKLSFFLLGGIALLAVILLIEWQYARFTRADLLATLETGAGSNSAIDKLPELDLSTQTLESYAEIVNRPLFIEGRRPIEEAEDVPALTLFSGKLELMLSGVVNTPEGMIALIQDKKKKNYQLKLHDAIEGWEVDSIDAEKVVMKRNNKRTELLLRKPHLASALPARPNFKLPQKKLRHKRPIAK